MYKELECITKIGQDNIKQYENSIGCTVRTQNIIDIANIINDHALAIIIEFGIFEYAIVNNIDKYNNKMREDIVTIYNKKKEKIINILTDSINNKDNIIIHIENNIIRAQNIAFLNDLQWYIFKTHDKAQLIDKFKFSSYDDFSFVSNYIRPVSNIGEQLMRINGNTIEMKNRMNNIYKIYNITKDLIMTIKIEYGIFEFSMIYVNENKHDTMFIPYIYNEKFNEIIEIIDFTQRLYSAYLIEKINNNKIDPQNIAFLSPVELNKPNWKNEISKKEYREYVENNHETTDIYKCSKCHERKTKVHQMQTRGTDEPTTTFVTCQVCNYKWDF